MKILLTIIFIVLFAYLAVNYNYMSSILIPEQKQSDIYMNKKAPDDLGMGGPIEEYSFWEDPEFYIKAVFGSIVGYLIRWILEICMNGVKFVLKKI